MLAPLLVFTLLVAGEPEKAPAPAPPAPPVEDFDKDGVPDLEDDCPTDAGNPKKHGCPGNPPPPPKGPPPTVGVSGDHLDLGEAVEFKTGSAALDPKSYALLASVAAAIKALPAEKKLSIEGHTDAQGNRKKNLELSQKRAEAVIAQLAHHGIDRTRLSAKGHGPDKPIAPNTTKDGRAKNRRVEFLITE